MYNKKCVRNLLLIVGMILLLPTVLFSQVRYGKDSQYRDVKSETEYEEENFNNYIPTVSYNLTEKNILRLKYTENLYKNFISFRNPKQLRDAGIITYVTGFVSTFIIGLPIYSSSLSIYSSSLYGLDPGLFVTGSLFLGLGSISQTVGAIMWIVGQDRLDKKNKAYYYYKLKKEDELDKVLKVKIRYIDE